DIGTLPVYNQDLEETAYPAAAKELREKIKAADGVLLAVPEFNRGVASSMKNFLDWSSRPENEPLPWAQKPVGVMGASSGMRGANLAQFDVRRTMGYFNAFVMPQPEFYLANDEDGKFDSDMNLVDAKSLEYLKKFLDAFAKHIQN
ncbi:MAG: NAD(P)H-dependent oxidoreductase, partial [Minisyncoccia bacterium]